MKKKPENILKNDILNLVNQQKGLAPILIVILMALAIGGYLIYQKQFKAVSLPITQSSSSPIAIPTASNSVETANWKTYANHDYQFNYPNDWQVESTEQRNGPQDTSPTYITTAKNVDFSFIVSQDIISPGQDVQSICGGGPGPQPTPLKSIEVSNIKTSLNITSFWQPSDDVGDINVSTNHPLAVNGKVYCLFFDFKSNGNDVTQKSIKILDQILSTFKFTQ